MGVVENELVADTNEPASERPPKVHFGEHLFGSTKGDGFGVEQEHPIAASGLVQIVRCDDDGSAVGDLVIDEFENHLPRRHVETGDGLIEHEHVGLLRDPLSDKSALTLPARKLVDLTSGKVRNLETPHCLIDGVTVDSGEAPEQAKCRVATKCHRVSNRDRDTLVDISRLQHERWRRTRYDRRTR